MEERTLLLHTYIYILKIPNSGSQIKWNRGGMKGYDYQPGHDDTDRIEWRREEKRSVVSYMFGFLVASAHRKTPGCHFLPPPCVKKAEDPVTSMDCAWKRW